MVDLASVVEVMLDHYRDDPAGLLQLTPVRHPQAKQLGVIQRNDTLPEPRMPLSQPPKSLRTGRERVTALDEGVIPGELCIAEGVVVVHVLAAADVLDDVADRALSPRWDPEPVLGRDGMKVAQQRMPFRSLERLIQEIYKLRDGWCCHNLHYTPNPLRNQLEAGSRYRKAGKVAATDGV